MSDVTRFFSFFLLCMKPVLNYWWNFFRGVTNFLISCTGFSKCQKQRLEALGTHSLDEKPEHPIVGRFVPQCAADGSYEEVQCYGSTGYCWCVDVGGNPVDGTMTRGLPHCNKTALGGTL